MQPTRRSPGAAIALPSARRVAAVLLSGCGSSEKVVGGSARVVMATPPDYLDPQLAYTTEAAEADWIAYTPLLTYRHKGGADGTELIPGLAQRLPRISPDGRSYRLALRKGLVYSNGRPVMASDFEYTIERAIRLGWPGKRFLTDNIVGAEAFERGEAKDIAGIATDDASGQISIKLIRPWGAFENVLALPATGLVPTGTPMQDLSAEAPAGRRRIPDHRRRPRPPLDDGEERSLRAARAPRYPLGEPGADRRQGRTQPGCRGEPGAGRSRGRL